MAEHNKNPATNPEAAPDQVPDSANSSGAGYLSRRSFLWVGAGAAAGLLLAGRTCFYENSSTPKWSPVVLADWEVVVLAAAAGALIPETPTQLLDATNSRPSGIDVARKVDGFLHGLPASMLLEIHAMFGVIEHSTILGGHLLRFTRLSPAKRLDFLLALNDMGSKFGEAFRGIRDLSLLGWYAHPKTWKDLGYDGPLLERPAPSPVAKPAGAGKYARLLAPIGTRPDGAV